MIRDPDVSWDGQRVLFAWKKSDREDDYHLYEMDVADGSVRQITYGLGFADYEGVYLPERRHPLQLDPLRADGGLLVDGGQQPVHLRRGRPLPAAARLSTRCTRTIPTVLDDGRVVYTRWDYNDRGQIFVAGAVPDEPRRHGPDRVLRQQLVVPDLAAARARHPRHAARSSPSSPATTRARRASWGSSIRPGAGRRTPGVQLIAPVRDTPAERIDAYGQDGELFQYPYPLTESEFLVTYAPLGWSRAADAASACTGWTADGRRELLAADPGISCNQPVPLAARPRPPRAGRAWWTTARPTGTCFLQDVYDGPGLAGDSARHDQEAARGRPRVIAPRASAGTAMPARRARRSSARRSPSATARGT